jgi:hypothetical protein
MSEDAKAAARSPKEIIYKKLIAYDVSRTYLPDHDELRQITRGKLNYQISPLITDTSEEPSKKGKFNRRFIVTAEGAFRSGAEGRGSAPHLTLGYESTEDAEEMGGVPVRSAGRAYYDHSKGGYYKFDSNSGGYFGREARKSTTIESNKFGNILWVLAILIYCDQPMARVITLDDFYETKQSAEFTLEEIEVIVKNKFTQEQIERLIAINGRPQPIIHIDKRSIDEIPAKHQDIDLRGLPPINTGSGYESPTRSDSPGSISSDEEMQQPKTSLFTTGKGSPFKRQKLTGDSSNSYGRLLATPGNLRRNFNPIDDHRKNDAIEALMKIF